MAGIRYASPITSRSTPSNMLNRPSNDFLRPDSTGIRFRRSRKSLYRASKRTSAWKKPEQRPSQSHGQPLQQVLGHHRVLLAARQGVRLIDDYLLFLVKPVAVAVRADVNFGRHNRVTASTDLILRGIANDATSAFFSFTKGWIKLCHTIRRLAEIPKPCKIES